MPDVALSVIIVNWNGVRYLPECLAALVPQLPVGAELIVVENGSTDGSREWLMQQPAVLLVALDANIGFAAGVNAGLRVASGEAILLVNNDAFVEPGCIAALCAALQDYPDVAAFGGLLLFDHAPHLVASAGIVMHRDGLALDLWPCRPVSDMPAQPQPIFGPSGGLALYRRALLDDVGVFDPQFFAYLEDADLAVRAVLRGWRSLVVPAARARHVYSATGVHGSPFKSRLLARNRWRVIVRGFPTSTLMRCAGSIAVYELAACAVALLTRRWATLAGRLAALGELGDLLAERRAIQRRRCDGDLLGRALAPARWPWDVRTEQRRLDTLLHDRTTP